MKRVTIKYKSLTVKVEVPRLRGRARGVKFPLMNFVTGRPLPLEEQLYTVLENEANDLVRCHPALFEIVVPKKKATKTEEGSE